MSIDMRSDICIVGGGLGGVAAALATASKGYKVILVEQTDWLGGQLTSQAVPPDEHPWIESFGCTASYRKLRYLIRRYYYDNYSLSQNALTQTYLNPGGGTVSKLCCEPRSALIAINQMLAPYLTRGNLQVIYNSKAIKCYKKDNDIEAMAFQDIYKNIEFIIESKFFLDATELGDVLPLADVDYVFGAESKSMTSEPDAKSDVYNRENVQAITWCFAVEYDPNGNHLIDKPANYDKWKDYVPQMKPSWPGKLFSWEYTNPFIMEKAERLLFSPKNDMLDFWHYRRIVNGKNFMDPVNDVTIVNWPQNDYLLNNIIDKTKQQEQKFLNEARDLSLCLFYWLQTEAPRHDKGYGYPQLKLRPDITGTIDGFAKYPYIRESRRIVSRFTVTENYVAAHLLKDKIHKYEDSVGIGCYRIDLHPTTLNDNYFDISSYPFQIPMGALIPKEDINLLPAAKNIGTTHITNGCYRLHPVEWNIGESAGILAAYCIENNDRLSVVYNDKCKIAEYQKKLLADGIELDWPSIHSV